MPKHLTAVLGTAVWVAIAASSAVAATPVSTPSARAAPAIKGCTAEPTTPSPLLQRLYSVLGRTAKSECRPRGPLGRAAQKGAKPPSAHRTPAAHAAAPQASAAPAAARVTNALSPAMPPTPHATATQASAAPDADPAANTLVPAMPPAPAAVNPPPAAPAPQALVGETREPDLSAPAPMPPPAPATAAAPAPQLAAQAARAAAVADDADHSFGLAVLAVALLIIAGPVLGITRLLSVLMARVERRTALRG